MQCVYSAQNSWLLSQGYPGLGDVDKDMELGLIKQLTTLKILRWTQKTESGGRAKRSSQLVLF